MLFRSSTRAPRRHGGRTHRTGSIPLKPRVVFCVEGASEEAYLRAILNYRYDDAFAFVFWRSRGSKSSLRNLIEHDTACKVNSHIRFVSAPGKGSGDPDEPSLWELEELAAIGAIDIDAIKISRGMGTA